MDWGSLTRIPQALRNIGRGRQILTVLTRHGFADVLARVGLEGASQTFLKIFTLNRYRPDPSGHSTEERIRMAMEELGPTFVKLGQILATRPDLVPLSLVHELKKLEDRVLPFPGAEARAEVESELGKPVGELFQSFEEAPLAAGSIAQVHRAVLKDGQRVVVKVRRPGLERIIRTDLDIMAKLAQLMEENLPESRSYHPRAIVAEFARSIVREIDFTREAFSIRKFERNFRDDERFVVPRVYPEMCTKKLLTVEFIDGLKVTSLDELRRGGHNPAAIARNGVQYVLLQIFRHGFFHGDPHAGNMFVLPGDKLCLVDYGLMGALDEDRLDELLSFMAGVVQKDAARVVRSFRHMGIVPEETDLRALRLDAQDLVERYTDVPLGRVDIGRFFAELFEVLTRHQIRVPADIHLLGKALATAEGIARQLDPGLDLIPEIRPFIVKTYLERLARFRSLGRDVRRAAEDYARLFQALPGEVNRILTQLRKGELEVAAHFRDQDRLVRDGNRSSNRVATGLVMAGILIGSAMLVITPVGPALRGIQISTIFGALGFIFAGVLGLGLAAAVWRSGGV
ncbi:MAG: AarF/ABC1/UbiB kinase family protein [Candidatus Brocadiae bacterium]|nr:AarF/ABC1/UbiB kinase family protein [Candidatus Brocadiia bacterium]